MVSESVDMVITHNCLDHVINPDKVVTEIYRLIKKGGYFWIYVDLMEHTDPLHPHAFTETKLKSLLAVHGFQIIQDAVCHTGGAHKMALGQYRGLLTK